ncbi:MAG: hypothetical protein M3R17_13735 [Bacteroidota bacterium]|nr:hypothetical protein [Bacteroidota bacterium]
MKQLILILLFAFLFGEISIAQDTLVLVGNYTGNNLCARQSFDTSASDFCIKKILVNDGDIFFEKNPRFTIKLTSLDLHIDDTLKIEIIHDENCSPEFNMEAICAKCKCDIFSIHIENDSILKWRSAEDYDKFIYIVQQFKWNKWISWDTISSAYKNDTVDYRTRIGKYLHSGENQFRVIAISKGETISSSKVVKMSEKKGPVLILNQCTTDIKFNHETYWEIYDMYGAKIKQGYGKTVPTQDLDKGGYFLNYDNATTEFFKR